MAVGLWYMIESAWIWGFVSFVVFWIIAYIGHRFVPKLTGPVVDRIFPVEGRCAGRDVA